MRASKKSLTFRRTFKLNSLWISLGLSCLIVASYALLTRPKTTLTPSTNILELIEAKTVDLRFLLRGKRPVQDAIAIVAVDEKTENELGRWQSSGRRWFADLLDVLHDAGAQVIGFDVTFAEPDEGAAAQAVTELEQQYLQQTLDSADVRATLRAAFQAVRASRDYDQRLAAAIRRAGNVILGTYHFFNREEAKHLTAAAPQADQQRPRPASYNLVKFPSGQAAAPLALSHAYGVESNLPAFAAAAQSAGFFTLTPDADGCVRRAPLLVEYGGEYYPALSLEIARVALGVTSPVINALNQQGRGAVDFIKLGKLGIPTDESGQLLINFYGPQKTFPHYSLSDVVKRKIPAAAFAGKIVLVGFTGSIYKDVVSTPLQAGVFPGVEVHATIIENMLRADFLIQPRAVLLLDGALIFGLALLLGAALQRVRALRWVLLWAAFSLLAVLAIALAAFLWQRICLNVTFPALFILFDYLLITSHKYFTEEKQRRLVKQAFEHYVAPAVVRRILEASEHPELGQEKRILSIIFSDIRGFTKFSEKMDANALTEFLEEYFTPMIEIIAAHEGTVDKFIGDAIMVFYGAPQEQPDHAVRACKTAVEMAIRVAELDVRWQARGLPNIDIGLGIHTGEVSVGNIGAKERFNYTIMGDHVNLASQLEGVNKQYGTNLIISQATHDRLPPAEFLTRELDVIRVKGKDQQVKIYELLGYGTYFQQKRALAEQFDGGVAAYRQRQWEQAYAIFQDLCQRYPADVPAKIYLERCRRYRQEPPPDDWDGVIVMETK